MLYFKTEMFQVPEVSEIKFIFKPRLYLVNLCLMLGFLEHDVIIHRYLMFCKITYIWPKLSIPSIITYVCGNIGAVPNPHLDTNMEYQLIISSYLFKMCDKSYLSRR